MAKCVVCGEKGLFLRVNEKGMCKECQKKFEEQEKSREREQFEEKTNAAETEEKKEVIPDGSERDSDNSGCNATISTYRSEKAYFLDIVEDHYILAYQYEHVKIAMPVMGKVDLGDFLSFEQEPNNEYDNKAVKVTYGGYPIGYLYRGRMQDMVNDFMRKELPIEARVDSIDSDSITCGIAFYKDINSYNGVTATLTKTSKKDFFDIPRQDNLSCISEGDELSMEYDYETETYVVSDSCGSELGEISKSVSEKLYSQQDEYTYRVICVTNELDDNLKYKCKIKVLFM